MTGIYLIIVNQPLNKSNVVAWIYNALIIFGSFIGWTSIKISVIGVPMSALVKLVALDIRRAEERLRLMRL